MWPCREFRRDGPKPVKHRGCHKQRIAMKTYRTSEQHLTSNADVVVSVPFKGGAQYDGPLGGLSAWLKERPNLDCPLRCTVDGKRHGFRFVLTAKTERGATALSVLVGHEIMPFDGWTYATKSACLDHFLAMKRAGIVCDGSWLSVAITEQPYAQDIDAPAPKPKQEELDLTPSPSGHKLLSILD